MFQKLKFSEQKVFKIMQLTDVHLSDGSHKDKKTLTLIEKLIDLESPDFIALTGDTSYFDKDGSLVKMAADLFEKRRKPWAAVFGNHDNEPDIDKNMLLAAQMTGKMCLSSAGPENIHGVGNYIIPVYSEECDKPKWILYFLDSGSYNQNQKVKGYDFIHRDQIQWYIEKSDFIKEKYGNLPALMFFHIPLPEYNEVWNTRICYGEKGEECCCSNQNSGMFSAMLEMGNVKGVFVGHDHINNYFGELYGIRLCYGRATGYNTYSKEGYKHGARIIQLCEGTNSFDTWERLEDGSILDKPARHKPLCKHNNN